MYDINEIKTYMDIRLWTVFLISYISTIYTTDNSRRVLNYNFKLKLRKKESYLTYRGGFPFRSELSLLPIVLGPMLVLTKNSVLVLKLKIE